MEQVNFNLCVQYGQHTFLWKILCNLHLYVYVQVFVKSLLWTHNVINCHCIKHNEPSMILVTTLPEILARFVR